MEGLSSAEIINLLKLQPHPEGGHFAETFRNEASTAIYYLLEAGDRSHWHRVIDSTEVWHHYAGGPLALALSSDGHQVEAHRLGKNINLGESPQVIVPPNWWQSAESLGRWTLVGCTVAPAFDFNKFEMAPEDWRPTSSCSG
ncbi:MAG: cupin [Rhizobiaceae bacterium]|nr:cupin [Rhizobiaceae bacterium]